MDDAWMVICLCLLLTPYPKNNKYYSLNDDLFVCYLQSIYDFCTI